MKVIKLGKMFANLHFHSTHSDGVDTPAKLVEIAKDEGYKALALTDHDTATGNKELIDACKVHGLDYIVGAELTGTDFGRSFHIVALDFDIEHPQMKQHLEYMSQKCIYRTKGMFENGLKRGTLNGITWDEVVEFNKGITYLCVDHVFAAMKAKGVIKDSEYTVFHKQNFSYTIPFENIYHDKSVKEVISIINSSGGIAILAHGGYGKSQFEFVPQLVEWGLKGIETWHADHTDENAFEAERLAKKYNLYESGGTDHSGIMGGQYKFFDKPEESEYYIPSMKYGVSEENFCKIKNRVLG